MLNWAASSAVRKVKQIKRIRVDFIDLNFIDLPNNEFGCAKGRRNAELAADTARTFMER
jgi:hypothetical protein